MYFADTTRGRSFSKDPAVIFFQGRYWLYYTKPSFGDGRADDGHAIGIATSQDLDTWQVVGEILPSHEYERNGLCAPGAIVLDGIIHLFYQTYGNGRYDAICHAISEDGLIFSQDSSNPVFSPTGDWNAGRAIDADVIIFDNQLWLYFATRDPDMQVQMLGVASAPLGSGFGKDDWTQRCDASILKPELPWEITCIEAPALCRHKDRLFLFYGGAYNNSPQQIGVAVSSDAIHWQRLSDLPFMTNGKPGSWNQCESGHPFFFHDPNGRDYLFFQGDADHGKNWFLSKCEIGWKNDLPFILSTDLP
jgi:beta-1,2-mannobiose phosphorylase / 1,2-beta-oligomannan phosphorylase